MCASVFVCVCVFVDLSAFVCRLGKLNCSAFVNGTKQGERQQQGGEGAGRRHAVCSQATHLLQELYLILHLGERVGCASVPQRRTSFNCNICLNVAR